MGISKPNEVLARILADVAQEESESMAGLRVALYAVVFVELIGMEADSGMKAEAYYRLGKAFSEHKKSPYARIRAYLRACANITKESSPLLRERVVSGLAAALEETIGSEKVVKALHRIPERGEVVRHPSGVEFEVLDVDPRRIRRLRVRQPAASRSAA